jgi:hypothetical protein
MLISSDFPELINNNSARRHFPHAHLTMGDNRCCRFDAGRRLRFAPDNIPDEPARTAPSPASGQPADQAGHNDADITFAQRMIPHHAQAIAMAEMAATRATSPKVRELADNIKQTQQPEIDQMIGWLQAWGTEVPSTNPNDMGDMDHGAGGSMPGMMSPEQTNEMSQAGWSPVRSPGSARPECRADSPWMYRRERGSA